MYAPIPEIQKLDRLIHSIVHGDEQVVPARSPEQVYGLRTMNASGVGCDKDEGISLTMTQPVVELSPSKSLLSDIADGDEGRTAVRWYALSMGKVTQQCQLMARLHHLHDSIKDCSAAMQDSVKQVRLALKNTGWPPNPFVSIVSCGQFW